MLTEEMRDRIWSSYDRDGMLTPCVDTTPFGMLGERMQEEALYWLAVNVYPVPPFNDWGGESSALPRVKSPAAYITSHEIGGLLHHQTGIFLTDAQVQEAMLLLGIEPLDGSKVGWVYKVYQSSPCASITVDESGGLKEVDRSLRVAAVHLEPPEG